ncbi:hypothetical protein D3C77_394230 [compost metagenome]
MPPLRQHQQATVEPGLMDRTRLAGRHQGIVFGMHDQRGNLQLIATDVQTRDLYTDVPLDLADKGCPRPRRHTQAMGETAQYTQ